MSQKLMTDTAIWHTIFGLMALGYGMEYYFHLRKLHCRVQEYHTDTGQDIINTTRIERKVEGIMK